jgi:hypothetical protein
MLNQTIFIYTILAKFVTSMPVRNAAVSKAALGFTYVRVVSRSDDRLCGLFNSVFHSSYCRM